jgi:hypothetical protein
MKEKNCEIETLIKDEDDGEDADEDADDENQLPVEMRKYIYTQNPSQLNHPPTSPLLSLKPISESSRALTNLPSSFPIPHVSQPKKTACQRVPPGHAFWPSFLEGAKIRGADSTSNG